MDWGNKAFENKPLSVNPYGAARAYPEHDCYAWNVQHYISRTDYHASQCGLCGTITGFKWHKLWRRIFSLFSSEPQWKTDDRESA